MGTIRPQPASRSVAQAVALHASRPGMAEDGAVVEETAEKRNR